MAYIIIVDDHEQDRYLLETLLKGSGHTVTACMHGADALDAARRSPPDLIVSDILMPVMDGFTLCREWRMDPALKSIPFVYYTATYTDPRDEKFALEQGADTFIVKPQEPGILMNSLEKVLCEPVPGTRSDGNAAGTGDDYYKMYSDVLVRKLEDKVELFRTMFNVCPNLLLLLSSSFIIKEINVPAERLLGVKGGNVIDTISIMDFIEEQARSGFREMLDGVMNGVSRRDYEVAVTAHDRVKIISWSAGPVMHSSGTTVGIFLVGVDITEKLAAQKKIAEIEYQLNQTQKMEAIGQLAGGIAHDVRNYISGISGLADLISLEIDKNSPVQAYLRQIFSTCDSAVRLTQQLLTFSSGTIHQPQLLDLNEQLAKMDKLLGTLPGSGVKFHIESADKPYLILADPGQIEQVIMNLVINARDAITDRGEIVISTGNVVVDSNGNAPYVLLQPGAYAVLKVRDTGTGMDDATLAHMYEPFFTTKGKEKGTGLGLSTVYGIVRRCDGFIQCESKPGAGTVFRLYFPKAAT